MKIAVIYKKFFVFFNISLISAILFSLFNFFLPNLDPITIDSQSYLNHHTLRTPGYPLFLKICYFFSSNNLEFVCLIQQLFLIISGSICFQVCSIFFRRKEFCVFLGILAIGNPLMWKYSNLILSESLYMSFSLIFFSFLILGIKKKNSKILLMSSFFLGLVILIRPVGYAFMVPFIIILLCELKKFRLMIKSVMPVAFILFLTCSYNFFEKGYFSTQIFGGYNIVGQISHIIKSENSDLEISKSIEDKLYERNRLIEREDIGVLDKFWITTTTYNFSVWQVISPLAKDFVNKKYKDLSQVEKQKLINKICWRLSFDAIYDNPIKYLQIVTIHFYSMWTIPHITNLSAVSSVSEKLEDLNADFQIPAFTKSNIPDVIIYIKIFLSLILFSYSILSIYVYVFIHDTKLLLAAACSLLINFNHVLISLVEPAIPRYILTVLPFIIILSGIMTQDFFDFCKRRRS